VCLPVRAYFKTTLQTIRGVGCLFASYFVLSLFS
jgi:hypothetical protein